MSRRKCTCVLTLFSGAFLWLVLAAVVPAQLTDGTLKGTVTDSSGAVVPDASVVATNEGTGQTRTTTSDGSGVFTIPNLAPGAYSVNVSATRFKTFDDPGLELSVGKVTEIAVRLQVGEQKQTVEVSAAVTKVPVATDGRLSDTLEHSQVANLPVPNRDIFFLPILSAGAARIPGTPSSAQLTPSPSVTVNGSRYRGNDYVLDGSMDTNPNDTGEPAIVPSLEAVVEVQVQTGNFSSEYGRGNGSVVNVRTKSGTNQFHGAAWEYHQNAALNARNFFAASTPPQVFNQFGANLGGPIIKEKTFFFANYEGTRNALGQALAFQVETPEFRNYVFGTHPSSVAADLLKQYPAPTPAPGSGGKEYQGEVDITTPQGPVIPGLGTVNDILRDDLRYDQYLTRIDHSFNHGKDALVGRWIAEYERNNGATSSSTATLGAAMRGFRGPFDGFFGNLNLGEVHIFNRVVNDARFSFQDTSTEAGKANAEVPQIFITGVNAPFGDVFHQATRLRTYEARDTLSLDRGRHLIRTGAELRRIFKGLNIGPANTGSFYFDNLLDFAADTPFEQVLTVTPASGEPTGIPRYFTLYEYGVFVQDDWKATSRLTLNLGARQDYFGAPSERNGLLSSITWGPGSSYTERLAGASVGRVSTLYHAQALNLSPRIGLAYDPFGDGKTSVRAGYSLAYSPPHGQSIAGARANPPDAIQATLEPNVGIGTNILYGIPVPFNPEFKTTLNSQGGVVSAPGTPPIRIIPWIVNPNIRTQYSESWFFNVQREVASNWIVELGYVGTNGINLERIDDINRFAGDLVVNHGDLHRINPNFGTMSFVSNGVTSSYNSMTAAVRHQVGSGLLLQANYRWSKWLDDGSDTSPHLVTNDFPDKSNPGPDNEACLRCDRGPSMFDIPQSFTASVVWMPRPFRGSSFVDKVGNNWQISTIVMAQAGRPFTVYCSASFQAGCDFNADGGGDQFGGFYDRPDAPASGAVSNSFNRQEYLKGLFSPSVFPVPEPGTEGTLGRDTFRGPLQVNTDVALARSFRIREGKALQLRVEAFNALNNVNLYLPNSDLALALKPDKTYSTTSSFGKSTRAFDPRTLQVSGKFVF